MTDKIWLLDSNPLKVKNNNDWLKIVKRKKTFHDIKTSDLEIGLYEMQKNIALFERQDTYTLGVNIQEFEQLEEIILNAQSKFEQRYIWKGKQGKRGKDNKYLFSELTNKLKNLKELMKESLYNPRLDKGYMHIRNLVNDACFKEIKLKKYSEVDIMLATTTLTRANNGFETYILTPDNDIAKILYASITKMNGTSSNGFKKPEELDEKIRVYNTYNDRMRKDTILAS